MELIPLALGGENSAAAISLQLFICPTPACKGFLPLHLNPSYQFLCSIFCTPCLSYFISVRFQLVVQVACSVIVNSDWDPEQVDTAYLYFAAILEPSKICIFQDFQKEIVIQVKVKS